MERARIGCVGGIVFDTDGRLLLILRGQEPAKGCWSVPGGRKEPGESDEVATAREVLEETGLYVGVDGLVGEVERDAPDGSVYVIRDFLCAPVGGIDPVVVRAGDDADEVGWFTEREMRDLDCAPGLIATFDDWRVWSLRSSSAG